MSSYDLNNKIVLVTGSSSGIGKATALAFANNNATVIVASKNEVRGKEVVED